MSLPFPDRFAPGWRGARKVAAAWFCAAAFSGAAAANTPGGASRYHQSIEPILSEYCYDCHADGMRRGGMSLDEFKSDGDLLSRRDQWWTVLKYLRAGLMPPLKKPHPSEAQKQLIFHWIKRDVFGSDPAHPDPGRVTIRRLNRIEYRNTVRDLMGVDFKADEEFPADDTGYGFDDIGDVLTISPMLLEKYMEAAQTIVNQGVPSAPTVMPQRVIFGKQFHGANGADGARLSFYEPADVARTFSAAHPGKYLVAVEASVAGDFDFDPGRCRLAFKADGREQWQQEFGWQNQKPFQFEREEDWTAGPHAISFELRPLTSAAEKRNFLAMRILSVTIRGPMEKRYWLPAANYRRFFFKDEPPAAEPERSRYAEEALRRFAAKAFRRPPSSALVRRLTDLARSTYSQPGKTFEDGVRQAMVAALASPHFLFRVEAPDSTAPASPDSLIDEYSLASRLSYFLWSTMPDDELFQLAARGELRKSLGAQLKRMLDDPKSKAFIANFTGQWLELRDVAGIAIDEPVVLANDDPPRPDAALASIASTNAAHAISATNAPGRPRARRFRRRRAVPPALELTGKLRRELRQETELLFNSVVREDRSALDLLDCDYDFLNGDLARYYGIAGVTGGEMRRVALPQDSPRGGLLTEASILLITSNPTRTSPVKRGQFILENILGMPAAPPPPNVPRLEASADKFKDRQPTLREILQAHRDQPLCASCHARMDPLGLALENFNALGLWRASERGQPIDASGRLITGESFHDARDLKRILRENHRLDFYRCLTEKLLTYALGRGLEYYDVETVDQIVDRLDRAQGRFSALLTGIVESAPFQKRRTAPANFSAASNPLSPQLAGTK